MTGVNKSKPAELTPLSDFIMAARHRMADLVDIYSAISALNQVEASADEDSLIDITRKNLTEYLDAISTGQTKKFVEKISASVTDIAPGKNALISLLIKNEQLKKQSLTLLIPRITQDVQHAIDISVELDRVHAEIIMHLTALGDAVESTQKNERDVLIEKLQRSEALYKQVQAITHVGHWSWDVVADDVHWTDELYRIYGLKPQSAAIKLDSFLALVHPQDVDLVMEQTRQTVEEKKPGNFYHRILSADGKEKILHARSEALVDSTGKVYKIIGTSQDVTLEKQLEKKIRDSQNFIEKIANATPCLIALYNLHSGKYKFVSAGLSKILGYSSNEVMEKGVAFFAEKIHPDDVATLMAKNTEALARANDPLNADDDIIAEFQYRLRHSDGEYRWVHTFGTIFDRNADGKVEHILNISLDITESIQASQNLRLKTAELEQSNANLEEFAFVVSHDLKEPLRKIVTFSDRLATTERAALRPEGKALLDKISNSTIRMQQMINDLLSLSVISADKSFLKANLKSLLNEVLVTFEHKIEETNATINISDLPDAIVVPSQIRQLFQNLLSNAFKFSRQNVPLSIQISHRTPSVAELEKLGIIGSDQFVEISVQDNGIGFENEFGEKIFAVFQRLHERSSFEGTGIGLAICKKIAEHHRGKIVADGRPGAGATFSVLLPC